MAPVTIAGALVEQNAEALAGLVLNQLARPGAPFVYGGFTSNVDMKSGAPAFGTPEYMKACILGGQMARRYGLPYRTSSTNAANSVDAQAAYETVFSLWAAIMGGGNLIIHSFGWMEGGLVASFEKFVLDVDLVQMAIEFLKPLDTGEDALGARSHPRGRAGRTLLRRPAHPRALRGRLLRAAHLRLAQLPAVDRRRFAGGLADAPTRCGSRRSPNTASRRWTRRSPRSSTPSWRGASRKAGSRRISDGAKATGQRLIAQGTAVALPTVLDETLWKEMRMQIEEFG